MSQVDEGLIHAWLDGQLSAEDAARVERLVASDAEWAAAAAEARGLVAGASRILGALDHVPSVHTGERQEASAMARSKRSRDVWSAPWLRAAAVVVAVAGISSVVWMRTPTDTSAVTDAPMTMRAQTKAPAESPAPGAGPAQSAATPGARAEEKQTTSRDEPPANRAVTSKAMPRSGQPTEQLALQAARRDSATLRVDSLARARVANDAAAGRVSASAPPVPLVEQGVVGALARTATDSAAKAVSDGALDVRLAGCWLQSDSLQSLADIAGRLALGQVARGGGGRGGRAAASGAGVGTGSAADARSVQEREEATRRTVAVFRFIAPAVTDMVTAIAPPTAVAAAPLPLTQRAPESSVAPIQVLTNAQTRMLPDTSYVAEFVDARGRTELTFRVVGDTIRGRSRLTVNTVALPERAFVAVKTACPR